MRTLICVVIGIHLGFDGYVQRQRKDHVISQDIDWNLQYLVNVKKSFGSLVYAHYYFGRLWK